MIYRVNTEIMANYQGFEELKVEISKHIDDDTSMSKSLKTDLEKAEESLLEAKQYYYQQLLLFAELKEILRENNFGLRDQQYEEEREEPNPIKTLWEVMSVAEAKNCLNISMKGKPGKDEQIFGLNSEDFNMEPRKKKIIHQNIQQHCIPLMEKRLKNKSIELYKFWNPSNKDSEGLALAKANQLAVTISNEQNKLKELQASLKDYNDDYSKLHKQFHKDIASSINEVEGRLKNFSGKPQLAGTKITSDWIAAKCDYIYSKIRESGVFCLRAMEELSVKFSFKERSRGYLEDLKKLIIETSTLHGVKTRNNNQKENVNKSAGTCGGSDGSNTPAIISKPGTLWRTRENGVTKEVLGSPKNELKGKYPEKDDKVEGQKRTAEHDATNIKPESTLPRKQVAGRRKSLKRDKKNSKKEKVQLKEAPIEASIVSPSHKHDINENEVNLKEGVENTETARSKDKIRCFRNSNEQAKSELGNPTTQANCLGADLSTKVNSQKIDNNEYFPVESKSKCQTDDVTDSRNDSRIAERRNLNRQQLSLKCLSLKKEDEEDIAEAVCNERTTTSNEIVSKRDGIIEKSLISLVDKQEVVSSEVRLNPMYSEKQILKNGPSKISARAPSSVEKIGFSKTESKLSNLSLESGQSNEIVLWKESANQMSNEKPATHGTPTLIGHTASSVEISPPRIIQVRPYRNESVQETVVDTISTENKELSTQDPDVNATTPRPAGHQLPALPGVEVDKNTAQNIFGRKKLPPLRGSNAIKTSEFKNNEMDISLNDSGPLNQKQEETHVGVATRKEKLAETCESGDMRAGVRFLLGRRNKNNELSNEFCMTKKDENVSDIEIKQDGVEVLMKPALSKNSGKLKMKKSVQFNKVVDGQYFDEDSASLEGAEDFVTALKLPKEKWQVPKVSILDNPNPEKKTHDVTRLVRFGGPRFPNMSQKFAPKITAADIFGPTSKSVFDDDADEENDEEIFDAGNLNDAMDFLLNMVMKNHIYGHTYNEETLIALHKVRYHLEQEIKKTQANLHRTKQAILTYESIGDTFKQLLTQYNQLTMEIDNKKWALSELNKNKI